MGLYNAIKNNKLMTASLATVVTGTLIGINGVFNIPTNYSIPEPTGNNINAYVKTLNELENNYSHNVTVRELLIPAFKDSLETTLNELEAKKDSLESLPTFEEDKKEYENEISESQIKLKKDENYEIRKIFVGVGVMCSSLLFRPIGQIFRKKKKKKQKEA